jgi:hypothetical protein
MAAVFVRCSACGEAHSYPLGSLKLPPTEVIKCRCGTIVPPPGRYWGASDYEPTDGVFSFWATIGVTLQGQPETQQVKPSIPGPAWLVAHAGADNSEASFSGRP